MKKFCVSIIVVICTLTLTVNAQTQERNNGDAYTIIVNPAENAQNEVRINWHGDLDNALSFCIYTLCSDSLWEKTTYCQTSGETCTVFDSLYSKRANGEDFYENVQLLRFTVNLDELEPGTEYMYKVGSDHNDMSEIHYFKTAPKTNVWTAGIISDFHAYPPIPNRQTVAMSMIETLEQANGKDLDFMLHIGDITAWGGSYSFWKELYSEPYFAKYMWAGVNGNHDNMSRGYAKQTNEYFRNVNNNPHNGYKGEEGVCYYFMYGNTLFIMLNNESIITDEGLEIAQQWVKDVIRANPAKFVVVVQHYQWFYGTTGKTSQYARWQKLFDNEGVDLAISGNNHVYARTNALYKGKETDGSIGTVYVQTPSADNERGQELKEWVDNTDIIKFRWSEGANTVGAMIMNADGKTLNLILYDRDGNEIDKVLVKAKK